MEDWRITWPRASLEHAVETLRRGRSERIWLPGSLARHPHGCEVLARDHRPISQAQTSLANSVQLFVTTTALPERADEWARFGADASAAPAQSLLAGLHIGADGNVSAAVWTRQQGLRPAKTLDLPGSGMHHLEFAATDPAPSHENLPPPARWSRLAGALTPATWERLRHLRIALVGTGRSGSLMAVSLARAGITRISLVDPDRIEPHNLDAMDGVSPCHIGRSKVEVVAAHTADFLGLGERLLPLAVSASSPRAITELREADFIISCVDDDGARLAVAIIAALYCRPLLDIGSAVLGSGAQREAGGDIRLVLPGEGHCLCCFGGLHRDEQIHQLITGSVGPEQPWQTQRAGSLRSLNQLNVHLGLRLLEDLVDERIDQSTWLRLVYTATGIPNIHSITPAPATRCALCEEAGASDTALAKLPELAVLLRHQMRGSI